MDWLWSTLNQVVPFAALALGGWIAKRIKTPTDAERAALLSRMAEDAAALLVSTKRTASWAVLLQELVRTLSTAAGIPTRNAGALERAAAAALIKAGAKPS